MRRLMTSSRAGAVVLACWLVGCGRLGFDLARTEQGGAPPLDGAAGTGGAESDAGAQAGAGGTGPPDDAAAGGGSSGARVDASLDGATVRAVSLPAFEDFEGAPSAWPTWATGGSTAAAATQPVHEGAGAFRMATAKGGGAAYQWEFAEPKSSGVVYLRGYFFIPSGQTLTDYIVLMEMNLTNGSEKFSFDLYPGNVFGSYLTTAKPEADGPMITDRWFCAELEMELRNPRGTARFWIDGALQRERTNVRTLFSVDGRTGIDQVRLSAISGPKQESFVVYADDFVAADTRVGCNGRP